MARTEARIKCAIWDDEDFRTLTVEAQWLYHAILEQKDLSLCGVLTWTPRRFSKLASNANAAGTKKALDLLRERRYVLLDEDTDELMVRTFITGDRVLDNPNSILGMSNSFGAIHSGVLRAAVVERLGEGFVEGLPDMFPKGLPKGFHDRLGKAFVQALTLTYTRPPPGAPIPPASRLPPPLASENGSSSTLEVVGDGGAEEEDHHGQGPSPTTAAEHVARLVAERRWAKLSADHRPPEGIRRERWLDVTAANLLADEGAAANIRAMLAGGCPVESIVDAFEPPERPAPPGPSPSREQLPPAFEIDEATGMAVPVSA